VAWLVPTSTKTADYTVQSADLAIFDLATAAANLVATLPAAAANAFCAVKILGNANGYKLTVNRTAPAVIDGALTTFDLDIDNECVFFESNGTDWFRVGNELPPESVRPNMIPVRFSPLALYGLQSANYTVDSSGNSRTLTLGGTIIPGPSPALGKDSISYAATGQLYALAAAFNLTGSCSGGVLCNFTQVATEMVLLNFGGTQNNVLATDNQNGSLRVVGGQVKFYQESGVRAGSSVVISPGVPIAANQWIDIGFARSGGTDVRLFLNGLLVGTATLTATTGGTANTGLVVGSRYFNGTNPTQGSLASAWLCGSFLSDAQMLYMSRLRRGSFN
jgi:hypothetical protein